MDWLASFTRRPISFLHLDINSCFSTIEQQANPRLRHQPTVVVARNSPSGCILAASYEAKRLGITTGTRLNDALSRYPRLNVVLPDPDKYRFVHQQIKKLLRRYTHLVSPWSIDEFNLDLGYNQALGQDLFALAADIKRRLKTIGDYLTVSIGLAPSAYLAKIAAGLKKPDGLTHIDHTNYQPVYTSLPITDLCGINYRLASRLYPLNILTADDLYHAPFDLLKATLGPAAAHYWHLRLRGFPVLLPDQDPKSFGHSFVLPRSLPFPATLPILSQLLQKALHRMRRKHFQAQGLNLYLGLQDQPSFSQGLSLKQPFFDDQTAHKLLHRLLESAPQDQLIRHLAVTLFAISPSTQLQLNLFSDRLKQKRLTQAVDRVNTHWGSFTLAAAPAFFAPSNVPDSIGFGRIRELE